MSQEKRRCPSDYSLEELEELEMELKRRRMESNEPPASITATANNNNNNNKGTLSIHTSSSILWDLLLTRSDFEIIRTVHVHDAMVLLRQHPLLVTKLFLGRSVLSLFMCYDVPSSIIQELCAMWKSINPQNDEGGDWQSTGFEQEPNFVLDACRYCSNPDTFRLLVKEFPDQAAIEDGPCELFLKRCDYDDDDDDDDDDDFHCEPRPLGQAAAEIFQVLFKSYMYEAKDLNLSRGIKDIILGRCYDEELSDLLATVVSDVFEGKQLDFSYNFRIWNTKATHRAKLFLPKLTHFQLGGGICNDGEDHIECYQSALGMLCEVMPSRLIQLQLPVLSDFIHQNVIDLFLKAIQSCPNLKDLTLKPSHYVSSTTARDAQAVCNLYQEILLLGTNNLEAFNVTVLPQTDGPSLSKLLQAAFAKLRSFVLAGYRQNDDTCAPFEIPPNSRLQSFKFAVSLGAKTTKGILGLLCGLTSLNSLNFHGHHNNLSEVDISDEILELLAQNRLESLGFCDIGVSFLESLVDGLKENTSLKKLCQCCQTAKVPLTSLKDFASMMEHNVLLEDVTLGYRYSLRRRDFRPTVAQIKYWADCNKCGRGKLSDPKAPLDELFVALETAKAKTPYSYYCPDKLWYGLLRANPGIWAEAALTGLL